MTEHDNFQQIAQQHGDKIDNQHDHRLVFVGQQNAVAAALNAFEWVIPHRAGGGTADMAALCGGAIDVFITKIVGAPAEVNILIVGKKQFVKNANFIQNGFSVQCCAATGRKNTAGLLVAAGFQAVAALAGKAQNRHIISGVIGQFRLVIAQHQAGYRKNLRVALSGFQQLFQPVRFGKGIVIE